MHSPSGLVVRTLDIQMMHLNAPEEEEEEELEMVDEADMLGVVC